MMIRSLRRRATLVLTAASVSCADYSAPTPPAAPAGPDVGSFTLRVTGALNATTHLVALPTLDSLTQKRDFVGMASPEIGAGLYVVRVQKAMSQIGNPAGVDGGIVAINPRVTGPGVYFNDSCPSDNGGTAACAGVTYSIAVRALDGIASLSQLTTLQDNRDTVTIVQLSPERVRLTVAGPWLWTRPSANGDATLVDTVVVRASFDAFAARD